MRTSLKVILENGNYFYATVNLKSEDAAKYYLGREWFSHRGKEGVEILNVCTKVEIVESNDF